MDIPINNSFSVTWLLKPLVKGTSTAAVFTTGKGTQHEKYHMFKYDSSKLIYESTYPDGSKYRNSWQVTWQESNLIPGTFKVYLLCKGHRVSKLYCGGFSDGVFFFTRHSQKVIYKPQRASHNDRCFFYHNFNRKIEQLLSSKKQLRLSYQGKPTRTAKRLEYYRERVDHYDTQMLYLLRRFVARY